MDAMCHVCCIIRLLHQLHNVEKLGHLQMHVHGTLPQLAAATLWNGNVAATYNCVNVLQCCLCRHVGLRTLLAAGFTYRINLV